MTAPATRALLSAMRECEIAERGLCLSAADIPFLASVAARAEALAKALAWNMDSGPAREKLRQAYLDSMRE